MQQQQLQYPSSSQLSSSSQQGSKTGLQRDESDLIPTLPVPMARNSGLGAMGHPAPGRRPSGSENNSLVSRESGSAIPAEFAMPQPIVTAPSTLSDARGRPPQPARQTSSLPANAGGMLGVAQAGQPGLLPKVSFGPTYVSQRGSDASAYGVPETREHSKDQSRDYSTSGPQPMPAQSGPSPTPQSSATGASPVPVSSSCASSPNESGRRPSAQLETALAVSLVQHTGKGGKSHQNESSAEGISLSTSAPISAIARSRSNSDDSRKSRHEPAQTVTMPVVGAVSLAPFPTLEISNTSPVNPSLIPLEATPSELSPNSLNESTSTRRRSALKDESRRKSSSSRSRGRGASQSRSVSFEVGYGPSRPAGASTSSPPPSHTAMQPSPVPPPLTIGERLPSNVDGIVAWIAAQSAADANSSREPVRSPELPGSAVLTPVSVTSNESQHRLLRVDSGGFETGGNRIINASRSMLRQFISQRRDQRRHDSTTQDNTMHTISMSAGSERPEQSQSTSAEPQANNANNNTTTASGAVPAMPAFQQETGTVSPTGEFPVGSLTSLSNDTLSTVASPIRVSPAQPPIPARPRDPTRPPASPVKQPHTRRRPSRPFQNTTVPNLSLQLGSLAKFTVVPYSERTARRRGGPK